MIMSGPLDCWASTAREHTPDAVREPDPHSGRLWIGARGGETQDAQRFPRRRTARTTRREFTRAFFSASPAQVRARAAREEWRCQAKSGAGLGLRLRAAQHLGQGARARRHARAQAGAGALRKRADTRCSRPTIRTCARRPTSRSRSSSGRSPRRKRPRKKSRSDRVDARRARHFRASSAARVSVSSLMPASSPSCFASASALSQAVRARGSRPSALQAAIMRFSAPYSSPRRPRS